MLYFIFILSRKHSRNSYTAARIERQDGANQYLNTLEERDGSSWTFFNPRYLRGKKLARRARARVHAGNGETRGEENGGKRKKRIASLARLPGYPWGLVWRRCSTFTGHVWATTTTTGGVRGRMAKSQRQTATSFSSPMPPDKSECMRRRRPFARSRGCITYTYARTYTYMCMLVQHPRPTDATGRTIRSRSYSHASSPPTRARIAGIRGICKIPTAHVTTNCCSADRPTHRRTVKL